MGSGESPGTSPHLSHNILYCSMRQGDSMGSTQKLDNRRNPSCFFFWMISVTEALGFLLTQLLQSSMEALLTSISMAHQGLPINGRHTALCHLAQTLLYRRKCPRILMTSSVCQEPGHRPEVSSAGDLLGTFSMNAPPRHGSGLAVQEVRSHETVYDDFPMPLNLHYYVLVKGAIQ